MKKRELMICETEDLYLLKMGKRKSKPGIRVQGNWLLKAGFEPGRKVSVQIDKGVLTIALVDAKESYLIRTEADCDDPIR